ncbi:MAG TPA: hypothetical protein VIU15_41975 [Streptomyces sp.]
MPLTPRQERDLLLMPASRRLVQAAVVGLALFTFSSAPQISAKRRS